MNRLIRAGLVLTIPLMLVIGASDLRAEHDATNPAQAVLEQSIHKYLLAHPDVIIEVLDILRADQAAAEARKSQENLAAQHASGWATSWSASSGDSR